MESHSIGSYSNVKLPNSSTETAFSSIGRQTSKSKSRNQVLDWSFEWLEVQELKFIMNSPWQVGTEVNEEVFIVADCH